MAKLKAQTLLAVVSSLVRPKANTTETHHTAATFGESPLAYHKPSEFLHLPEDILRTIADYMSPGARARVLQTCRYLHSLFEGIQYRRLDLTSSWAYYQAYRLHETLWERPDLISRIISYRGPLTPRVPDKRTKLTVSEKLKLRLRRKKTAPPASENIPLTETEGFRRSIFIFTKAVNIRELSLTDRSDWLSGFIWQPLRANLSKMSLTHLTLPRTEDPAGVVSMLRAQPELEHLELLWFANGLEELKETDIPKLKSLGATLKDAAILVPGRPLEEFRYLDATETIPDEQLVQKLSLSSATIIKLTARLSFPWDSDYVRGTLQILAFHLPEIQHLALTVDGVVSGQILLDGIPSFQSLRSVQILDADLVRESPSTSTLLVNGEDNEIAVQTPLTSDWNALFSRLRELCPSLVDTEYTPLVPPFCSCNCLY